MVDMVRQWRVFPRGFAIFYMYLTGHVIFWATALPDISNAQAALVASVVTAGAAFFKFYVETG